MVLCILFKMNSLILFLISVLEITGFACNGHYLYIELCKQNSSNTFGGGKVFFLKVYCLYA